MGFSIYAAVASRWAVFTCRVMHPERLTGSAERELWKSRGEGWGNVYPEKNGGLSMPLQGCL